MDLFCPHCTRRVTVADDKAGQVASCPLCAKQFMAPTLATPPAPKPPAPPPAPPPGPESTFSMAPPKPEAPSSPANAQSPVQSSIVYPPKDAAKPTADGGDGQYTRSMQLTLNGSWLAFMPTLCVALIFVLSFFPWQYHVGSTPQTAPAKKQAAEARGTSSNLWTLAYSDAGGIQPTYLAFVLLLVALLLATPAVAVMDIIRGKQPAKTDSLVKWAHLALTFFFFLGFSLLVLSWFLVHFVTKNEALGIGLECAVHLQFAGMAASAGLFWLSKRKPFNLPAPRMKIRW